MGKTEGPEGCGHVVMYPLKLERRLGVLGGREESWVLIRCNPSLTGTSEGAYVRAV